MPEPWSILDYAGDVVSGWFGLVSAVVGAIQLAEWFTGRNLSGISGKQKALLLFPCLVVAQALVNKDLHSRVISSDRSGVCGVIGKAMDGGNYTLGWISESDKEPDGEKKRNGLMAAARYWEYWANETNQGLKKYNAEWAKSFIKSTEWKGPEKFDFLTSGFVAQQMDLLTSISTKAGCG